MAESLEARIREVAARLDGQLGLVVRSLRGAEPRVELDATDRFPAASVIKLPILWSFLLAVDRGELDPDERWTLTPESKVGGSGVLRLLGDGLRLSLADLVTLMIVVSDNTATNGVLDRLGLDQIEAAIRDLGLASTALRRRMMDFAARDRGLENVTTPEDIAHLLARFATGAGLSEHSAARARRILLGQQLKNKLAARLPTGVTLAHKTGELPGLEHDTGWLEAGDNTVVVAAFSRDLRDNADGVAALAAIGHAVAAHLIRDSG